MNDNFSKAIFEYADAINETPYENIWTDNVRLAQEFYYNTLQFLDFMIKSQRLELAEIPYDVRIYSDDLYIAAFYVEGMLNRGKLAEVARILWEDAINRNTSRERLRFLAQTLEQQLTIWEGISDELIKFRREIRQQLRRIDGETDGANPERSGDC